jgi:glutaredoxin 3
MANGGKVTVYTTDPCGFCRQAKTLLANRGVDYEEVSLTKDPDTRAWLVQLTGQMTFPQIIAGERVIGGFRELLEADRDGTLLEILSSASASAAAGNGDRSKSPVPQP